jgi:hypothetical protein
VSACVEAIITMARQWVDMGTLLNASLAHK